MAALAELDAAVAAIATRYKAGYAIAAWCQLRRGEILGLRRMDIDVKRQQLTVRLNWVMPPGATRPVLKGAQERSRQELANRELGAFVVSIDQRDLHKRILAEPMSARDRQGRRPRARPEPRTLPTHQGTNPSRPKNLPVAARKGRLRQARRC